jgi:hypothetical protein
LEQFRADLDDLPQPARLPDIRRVAGMAEPGVRVAGGPPVPRADPRAVSGGRRAVRGPRQRLVRPGLAACG